MEWHLLLPKPGVSDLPTKKQTISTSHRIFAACLMSQLSPSLLEWRYWKKPSRLAAPNPSLFKLENWASGRRKWHASTKAKYLLAVILRPGLKFCDHQTTVYSPFPFSWGVRVVIQCWTNVNTSGAFARKKEQAINFLPPQEKSSMSVHPSPQASRMKAPLQIQQLGSDLWLMPRRPVCIQPKSVWLFLLSFLVIKYNYKYNTSIFIYMFL